MIKELFKTYTKKICSKCKNKGNCQEELRIRIDNSIKCHEYRKEQKNE